MSVLDRREFLKQSLAAASLLSLGKGSPLLSKALGKLQTEKKVIVLGFDGLDPQLLELWLREGKLPSFKRLISQGDFRKLGTSIPPQSPVAWSNFIAGTNPGGHGIFDFIHRDPKTYMPIFSGTETQEAKKTIKVGNLVLPLQGGEVKLLRKGKAFWQILEEHDIPATIFKIPSNYPPSRTKQRTISGMGTPDILGSYGICNYYTSDSAEVRENVEGARIHEVYVIGNRVEAKILGPPNTFKKDRPEAEIGFKVFIDPVNPVAKILIQDQEFMLKEREWSGWKRIRFSLIPTQSASGICMFYLKEVRPHFKLYVSAINIDPANPALPISTPDAYSKELEKRFGPFFTKGLPADTHALDNDILDDGQFLEMDGFVLKETLEIFDYELARFDSGLLFYYVSSTDQLQHMFWRLLDEKHPSYDPGLASKYGKTIENIYIEMDKIVAKTMEKMDKETILIIMSDHGFNPFYRCMNLNTWLKENGYHKLIHDWKQTEDLLFPDTDWSKTRAYALGLNGLYINQKGREREGIVQPGAESENLVREISQKLEQTNDPKTGERAVLRAFISKEVYQGPYLDIAPDIVVGFNRGYRISWGSPLGSIEKNIFEDNREKWSGDHMGAPEVMPGIVVTNRKIQHEAPALYDLTATILHIFGIEKPKEMIGRPIF